MAAPHKQGLDYFPHDCNHNHKLKYVEARHGLIGYGFYFKLLEAIYAKGEYLPIDDDFLFIFIVRECQIEYNKGIEILNLLLEKGLLDKQEYERSKRLTSDGIKERFAEATKRRKKDLPIQSIAQKGVNDNINPINVNINPINDDNNGQSKVKESIVNNLSSSIGENEKKVEKIGIRIGDYTAETMSYNLRQKTPNKFQTFQKKHGEKWETVLKNYLSFHENSIKPNFEEIAKHLLNYNFIGEENSKEKNFAAKKEKQTQAVTTEEEQAIKTAFSDFYEQQKGVGYYFTPKDETAAQEVLKQIKFQFAKTEKVPSEEEIKNSLKIVLDKGAKQDTWIMENLTLNIINIKFNEIIAVAKNGKPTHKNGQNTAQRYDEIGQIISQQFATEPSTDF